MKSKNGLYGNIPTAAEYAMGVHYKWEAAVHTAGQNFQRTHGRAWTWLERNGWIDAYMMATTLHEQLEVVACAVCQDAIAEAMLAGKDAFECPDIVRKGLKDLGVRVKPRDPRVVQNYRRS